MSKTVEAYIEEISKDFSSIDLSVDDYGMHNAVVAKNEIHGVMEKLKEAGFNFLTDLTGSHYPENEGEEFQVVYHLHHFYDNLRVRLKVNLAKDDLEIPSVTDLFAGANWMERETFDFYGIQFSNHPNLSRILNVDDMDYHPMRKEFALEDETRDDKEDKYFGR